MLFSKKAQNAVRANLEVIKKGNAPSGQDVKNVFVNFTKNIVELFCFTFFDEQWINNHVEIVGLEYVDACLKQNKSMILGAAHLGNWEIGCLTLALKKYPLHTVYWTHNNRLTDWWFRTQRRKKNMAIVSIDHRIAAKCMRLLRQNTMLALAVDRLYGEKGQVVSFFNKPVELPRGAAVLALKTGVPIMPTFCVRLPQNRFRLIFLAPRYYRNEEIACSANDPVAFVMADYLQVIEEYIEKYADQWCMFHKVFDSVPESKTGGWKLKTGHRSSDWSIDEARAYSQDYSFDYR